MTKALCFIATITILFPVFSGQFWQIRKDDKWAACADPVDYITVFQYDENGTVNSTITVSLKPKPNLWYL